MANTNRRYLSFDFVKDNIKDPIINFSRGSTKTIIDKNTGLVRTLGVNVPAAFDDACGRQELWKAGSKNLLPYSNDMSGWSKGSGTTLVKTTSYNALTISSGSDIYVYLPSSIPVGTYTFSFTAWGPSIALPCYLSNDTDGTRGTVSAATTATPQRFSLTGTTLRTNNNYITFQAGTLAGGSATFYISDMQLEAGSSATAYEPNPVVIQPGFLIEGAATNILKGTNIFDYWGNDGTNTKTNNAIVDPKGTQTASKHTGGGYAYYTESLPAGTYIMSGWAKVPSGSATFELNSTKCRLSDKWRRFFMPIVAGSNFYIAVGAFPPEIHLWGWQIESVSSVTVLPSSFISTAGSAVTRAADAATVDISKIWNASEGTVICEADFGPVNGALYQSMIDMTGNSFQMYRPPAGTVLMVPGAGGIAIAGSRVRAALSMFGTSVRSSVIGSSISSGTKSATASNLFIGTNSGNGEALNGTLQRLEYWPAAEDDYMLQQASKLS